MRKTNNDKILFNEMTRVQMPALVHLTRLGFTYYGRIFEDMSDKVYDPDTNILKEVFISQFKKLNPDHEGEAEQTLKAIRQELDNDDLGKSFYTRLTAVSPVKLIDYENPQHKKNLKIKYSTVLQSLIEKMVKTSSVQTLPCS